MPKPSQYRSGSLIYFQGDPADKVYILQNGKVSLVYKDIETGEDIRDQVQPGEFFGVKSALGRFPREENAIAIADSTIMAFTVAEFEAVAMANTHIIVKMLKVFSNQMRRIHKQVSSIMAKEEVSTADGLYNVGEYYLKGKRYSQAKYVFSRYLTYYPSGKYALQATKNLAQAESALSQYGNDRSSPGNFGAGSSPAAEKLSAAAEAYYEAVSLLSQERYQEAYTAFKAIVHGGEDSEWTARSSYEIGRCMYLTKRYEDCLKYYSNMLTQYPRHPDLIEAMYYMGQCNEKTGKKEQAAAFYKKILSMTAGSNDGAAAKAKRALQAMGV
ncbi:MAG: cyclic nucleotide-binding domain-containing protein [Treponema sp.]|nr:cyclic nucleotide-binding domain-containing protein [Treponema sp.]